MDKKAKIMITETEDVLKVSGPYNEMKDVYPKLKSKKFKYDGRDRSWYIDKEKYHGTIKDLEELINKLESDSKDSQAERDTEDMRYRNEFIDRCKGFKYVKVVPNEALGVIVYAPYNWFGTDFYKMKGKWNAGKFVFDRVPDGLYALIKKYEDYLDGKIQVISKYNNTSVGTNPYTISLKLDKDVLIINSSNRELRDAIKSVFPSAKWKDNVWQVSVSEVKNIDDAVSSMRDKCDALNKKLNEKKMKDEQRKKDGYMDIRYCTAWGGLDMRDYHVGQIVKNKWNSTPEYLKITKVRYDGKYEGMDYFFIVSYEPLSDKELNEYISDRNRAIKAKDAEKRVRDIVNIIQKRGNRPNKLIPSGDKYISERSERLSIYGGGEWIYIDGNKVIYVMDNGADGDDWSANNVSTGGAGGIGWILNDGSIAKELLSILEIAGWNKK